MQAAADPVNEAAVQIGVAVLSVMGLFTPGPEDVLLPAALGALTRGGGRALWRMTKEGTGEVLESGSRKYYQHRSTGLFWSKDTAGHGKSAWKVYEKKSDGLHWLADADEYGDFITNKHKSDVGKFIRNKDLHTVNQ